MFKLIKVQSVQCVQYVQCFPYDAITSKNVFSYIFINFLLTLHVRLHSLPYIKSRLKTRVIGQHSALETDGRSLHNHLVVQSCLFLPSHLNFLLYDTSHLYICHKESKLCFVKDSYENNRKFDL